MRDQDGFNWHVDYIHGNPVKHGWVKQVSDWPHSSFHAYVSRGVYTANWGWTGGSTLLRGSDPNDALRPMMRFVAQHILRGLSIAAH